VEEPVRRNRKSQAVRERGDQRENGTVDKTSGKALAKKYGDFLYPAVKVIVAGREIPEKDFFSLESAQVDSSVGREPDMAVLVYRMNKPSTESKSTDNQAVLEGYLDLGQKVEVQAGYGEELSRIFLGYLHQVEVCDLMQGVLEYTLICLDVKGLMKKNSVYQVSGAKKVKQVLDEIAGCKGYSSFIKEKNVSAPPGDLNQDCVIRGETHYDWLCNLAEYLDYEFFCCRGELHFRKSGSVSGELMELTTEYGLQAVRAVASMEGQTGSVSVCGYNRKDEKISGTAQWQGPQSKFTQKMQQTLQSLSLKIWDMEMETGEQAAARAKALMGRGTAGCFRMEAVNIGLPELLPGVNIKIKDENVASLSETIYVEEVCHRLDWEGYKTVVRGRR